jgi:hypothetical protein
MVFIPLFRSEMAFAFFPARKQVAGYLLRKAVPHYGRYSTYISTNCRYQLCEMALDLHEGAKMAFPQMLKFFATQKQKMYNS